MIQHTLQGMVDALSRSDAPQCVMPHIEQAFRKEVGFRLLTVTAIDRRLPMPVRRLWSSDQALYPVGGDKPLNGDDWTRHVIEEQRVMVCNTAQEIESTFPHDLPLGGLGVASGINLPIILNRTVLGTINVFHEAGWFTPERIRKAQALVALVYTPFLLALCHCAGHVVEEQAA